MSKCKKCLYEWESRVLKPKACPRCKSRLDFIPKQLKSPSVVQIGGI